MLLWGSRILFLGSLGFPDFNIYASFTHQKKIRVKLWLLVRKGIPI